VVVYLKYIASKSLKMWSVVVVVLIVWWCVFCVSLTQSQARKFLEALRAKKGRVIARLTVTEKVRHAFFCLDKRDYS
jgi:hypothetical protein